jgi:UDP-N-acetylmuramyl pentapeptide phosphotransferase/UDP-N-acetylglucosamine-1-phosphate transferase
VGGIGIVAAFCVSCAIFTTPTHLIGFLAGLLLLSAAGLADDMVEVSSRFKFAAQIAASLLMIYTSEGLLPNISLQER